MNGLDLFRSPKTAADEIADIVSAQCPPVVPENCDAFSCRECWLAWLTKGGYAVAITVHLSEILKERGMTALLLLDLCGGVLAHPEQPGTEQDRFVGFHLVYEPAPLPGEERNIEDEHWVEYGTQTLDAGPCGSSGRTPSPPGRPWTWAGPGPSPGRRVRPIPWR